MSLNYFLNPQIPTWAKPAAWGDTLLGQAVRGWLPLSPRSPLPAPGIAGAGAAAAAAPAAGPPFRRRCCAVCEPGAAVPADAAPLLRAASLASAWFARMASSRVRTGGFSSCTGLCCRPSSAAGEKQSPSNDCFSWTPSEDYFIWTLKTPQNRAQTERQQQGRCKADWRSAQACGASAASDTRTLNCMGTWQARHQHASGSRESAAPCFSCRLGEPSLPVTGTSPPPRSEPQGEVLPLLCCPVPLSISAPPLQLPSPPSQRWLVACTGSTNFRPFVFFCLLSFIDLLLMIVLHPQQACNYLPCSTAAGLVPAHELHHARQQSNRIANLQSGG